MKKITTAIAAVAAYAIWAATSTAEIQVGTDLYSYSLLWERVGNRDLTAFESYDIGFVALMWFPRSLIDFDGFLTLYRLMVFYAIINALEFALAKKKRRSPIQIASALTLAVAGALLYPPWTSIFNVVLRQGVSIALLLVLISRQFDTKEMRNSRASIALACLGMILAHSSAILPIAAIFIASFTGFRMILLFWLWTISIYLLDLRIEWIYKLHQTLMSSKIGVVVNSTVAIGQESSYYTTGYKLNFFLLNIMIAAILLAYISRMRQKKISILEENIPLKAYFILNAIGMLMMFLPLYDRFLLWSWAIAPTLVLYVATTYRTASKSQFMMRTAP